MECIYSLYFGCSNVKSTTPKLKVQNNIVLKDANTRHGVDEQDRRGTSRRHYGMCTIFSSDYTKSASYIRI